MIKLKEGDEYMFRVEKEITDPENEKFFLLTGTDGRKLLIPSKTYSDYGIKPGKKIICRIDRINCAGRVFLEPRHPYYKEGRSYCFTVIERAVRNDRSGKEVEIVVLTDRYGKRFNVISIDDRHRPGSRMKLKIGRISRGVIYPEIPRNNDEDILLRAGRYYQFKAEEIVRGTDDNDYFVISGPDGRKHTLPVKYYSYYGLAPGKDFRAKVVRNLPGERKRIEPVNPCYRTGGTLTVRISEARRNDLTGEFTLELIDKYGHRHSIETPVLPGSETIRCRVVRIRKGMPLLEPL